MTGDERRDVGEREVLDAAYAYALATLGVQVKDCGALMFISGNEKARLEQAGRVLVERAAELAHSALASVVIERASAPPKGGE